MLEQGELDALVGQFQLSAIGERTWSDTLASAADVFHSRYFLLSAVDTSSLPTAMEVHGIEKTNGVGFFASDSYQKGWRPHFETLPHNEVYFSSMFPELRANPWYQECLSFLGISYQLGAKLTLPNNGSLALVCMQTQAAGHPDEDTIGSFRQIAAEVQRAVALGHMIECEAVTRTALLDALWRKSDGILLLSRTGHPVFMNDAAERIVRGGDGLVYEGGKLATRRSAEGRSLDRLIHDATCDGPGGQMLVTRNAGACYAVNVLPVPRAERFLSVHSIACAVHIQDLSPSERVGGASLRTLFGLTEREADLAVSLIHAGDLARAAERSGMTTNTARNHLHAIFRKTGMESQVTLIRLLSRLGPG